METKIRLRLFLIIGLMLVIIPIQAQGDQATVPDLTGLTLPKAAALLNSLGLNLGTELAVDWNAASGLPENTIAEQALASNTAVARGTSVDVSVLRVPNMVLIYDDNDLTLVNTTLNIADLTALRFVSVAGNPASFAASRWASNVGEQRCTQIWSIRRNQSKKMSECEDIQNWLTTNSTGEHFWTQVNGVQEFAIVDNGIQRTTCPAATSDSQDSPLRCAFYFDGAGSGQDTTFYYYFAYTTDAMILLNPSEDKWMPTDRTTIYGVNATSAPVVLGDAATWGDGFTVEVGDLTRLAPNQCLLMTTATSIGADPPEACTPIAQQAQSSQTTFWLSEFEVESANDGQRHTCPAATPGRLTRCIVPQ
jgi:PASTA domain